MKRRYLTRAERLAMLKRQDFLCAICRELLAGAEYDHSTPVALGNDQKPDQAICRPCHAAKTKRDVKSIAKAKRLHRSWFGEKKPARKKMQSRPLDKRWRKRLDGTVVPQHGG